MLFSEAQRTFMCFILYMTVVEGRRSSICALKGSSVNLPCSAQHATSNMSWYTVDANGSIYLVKELSADGNTGAKGMYEETNFTLTIKDVRESDAKLYCCKESTESPESCSYNQTELRVAELQVKVIPATEGQTVTLMCSSSSCPLTEKPAAYIWYKNREFLYEDWSPWYQELLSGERGVTYSCAVKGYEHLRAPEVSVDSVTETCFSVTYTKRSMCSHKPKSKGQFCYITYPTALRVQITPASNFIIVTCNTSCPVADPHTLYQWYWNHMVHSDCERQDVTVLHTNMDVLSCAVKGNEDVHSDETCTAASCLAVNYVSRRICALEGSSVTIKSENSLVYYSWHKVKIGRGEKDCERVLSDARGHVEYNANENHILRINDVMRNDSAEYKLLSNSNQCHLPGVMLVVTGLKVTMTPSAVVTEGQRVTLTCSTSCPLTDNTNYIWYLNGRPLTPTATQTKHLILDPVSCDHQGNYSCALNASQMISTAEEGLTVKAPEKTVVALNTLKMVLLSLIPPAVFLLYLRARKKKTMTATAEQHDREQPGQMEAPYESVELMARKPAGQ